MTTPELLVGSDLHGSRRTSSWPAPLGVTVGALAVAIAVVMTTGIVAAVRLSGGGPQPEDVLPASTFAMARLDLDPAASQKLAVRALARRFPDAPGDDLAEIRDAIARDVVRSLGLDYDDDVLPWLGDRYGVAAFVAAAETQVLVVLQVEDADAARRAVEQAEGDAGVGFLDGYALIGESQAVVDAALEQTRAGTLAGDPDFTADIGALDGDQIAVGWADVGVLAERVLDDALGDLVGDTEVDAEGVRIVTGLHATRQYVELETVVVADELTEPAAPGGISTLTDLPAATTAAVHVPDASALHAGLGVLTAFGGFTGDLVLADGTTVEPPPTYDTDLAGQLRRVMDALDPVAEQLTNELLPLLNGRATLALGPLPGGGSSRSDLSVLLAAELAAPGNAEVPLLRARDALRGAGLLAEVTIRGRTVYAATGSAYVDDLGEPGQLGESDLFRAALGDLDDRTDFAAYLDLTDVALTQPGYPDELRPVHAVGMTASADGRRVTMWVRLVIR